MSTPSTSSEAVPKTISADAAIDLVQDGGADCVIDVRTGMEHRSLRIEDSRLMPMDRLDECLDEIQAMPKPRLLFCRTDRRARLALAALEGLGIDGLLVVEGGLDAYRQAGGPTASSGEHMSLERQVRITAGGLVLAGVLLGSFVHPGFLGLSGFVGAGLIFAGITDWCGMGLLLAKMPWNRID